MAKRFYFKSSNIYEEKMVEFTYYNGFAISQKQKCIESMHQEIKKVENGNILEVSTKSLNEIGKHLSAFNLKLIIDKNEYYIENIFQSSKVFELGGPYKDLLYKTPIEAKRDERIKSNGKIIGFEFNGIIYSAKPLTLFYDWIYCNAIYQNEELKNEIIKYDIFTDIEFNHNKSINTQARASAIFVGLYKSGELEKALKDIEIFKNVVYTLLQ